MSAFYHRVIADCELGTTGMMNSFSQENVESFNEFQSIRFGQYQTAIEAVHNYWNRTQLTNIEFNFPHNWYSMVRT